jgi:lysophospholipase L1-like esterase
MMKPMNETSQKSFSYLALGDSYTIGASIRAEESYPYQLTNALISSGLQNNGIKIIAQTGWTTSNLINAEKNAHLSDTFNLVSLLIGVNNQYQGKTTSEYRTEFIQLLDTAIVRAGGRKDKVFIISIPDYGYTPFGQNNQSHISEQIDIFNAINKQIADSAGITYFDITPISRLGLSQADLIASDGLHPSGKMYALWVDLIKQKVYSLISKP